MRPLSAISILLLGASLAGAENWAQWRGPFLNGSTTETNLPSQWSKTNGVAWVTPLPGYSGATPIVWEDSVFVSSPSTNKDLTLICLGRPSGTIRWQKVIAADADLEKGRNNMASPSPVTDGERVIALYATGDLAAFDFAGKELWKKSLATEYGKFAYMWIYGASPILYGGKLYVQVLQRSPVPAGYSHARDGKSERDSYLLCLDPATGKEHWRHVRRTSAVNESMESYATPIPTTTKAAREILVFGADTLTAHDPQSGRELWRWSMPNQDRGDWRVVPSPTVADDVVLVCGPKRSPVYAFPVDSPSGPTNTLAWKLDDVTSDCVTPLYYEQRLFVLDGDRQNLFVLDPANGSKKSQVNLGVREIFRASPTGADGKLYCISESGTAVVLTADDEPKVLATIPMGEAPVRSSIAAAHGQLFIRTAKNLYCIGAGSR